MKYAFPERNDGKIQVAATMQDSRIQIIVQDNGIGIPEYIDFDQSTGFGLQLVQALTLQLNGKIRMVRNKGTSVILDLESGEAKTNR